MKKTHLRLAASCALLALFLSASLNAGAIIFVPPPVTVMSGTTNFDLSALGFPGGNDAISYSVTTPLTGGIYTYSFTLSGSDIAAIYQLEIPLLNLNGISTTDITNAGMTASIVTGGQAPWFYFAGSNTNGLSAFNSPNITNVLLVSNFPASLPTSPSPSVTLDFTSPHAPVNGVYQLGFTDLGFLYVDPPTPGTGNVPEPAPWLLLVTGLCLLAGLKSGKSLGSKRQDMAA